MELREMFPGMSVVWPRWSDYTVAAQGGVRYLRPAPDAVELQFCDTDSLTALLTDALNLGQAVQSGAADRDSRCIAFAKRYGLLGLSPPGRSSLQMRGTPLSPAHQSCGSKEYGEEMALFTQEFRALYLHFLTAQGAGQTLSTGEQALLREQLGETAPSGFCYRLTPGSAPQLVWQPDSLRQLLRLGYALAITDAAHPLRLCKHCGRVYYNPHVKSEFCGARCRNYYNVKRFRSKPEPTLAGK